MLHQAEGLVAFRGDRKGGAHTAAGRRPAVLGIVSGKGGVGKSTLAVNLAVAAAEQGASVLLIDGDMGLANADLLLGLVPPFDLDDWTAGTHSLDEVLCRGPGGLELLVAGARPESVRRIERALEGRSVGELEAKIAAQDLTILDLGAGIGDGVVDLARRCSSVWLVATPEPTSLADAYSMLKRLWDRSPALSVELVVNRATESSVGERTQTALGRLARRFLGRGLSLRAVLPEDAAVPRSVARQTPVVLEDRKGPAARRMILLAESLLESEPAAEAASPGS